MTNHLHDAAHEIRHLFGPEAHRFILEAELTQDVPRTYIAVGLRVYDAAGRWLTPRYEAIQELDDALDVIGDDSGQGLLIWTGDHQIPYSSAGEFTEFLAGNFDATNRLIVELISNDTPFDLVQALNNLSYCPEKEYLLPETQDQVAERVAAYLYQSEFVSADEGTVREMAHEILAVVHL